MKHIFIVRHGQSELNANVRGLLSPEEKYVIDCKFGLTDLGKEQAYKAGEKIANLTNDLGFYMYVSPYERTRQTAENLKESLANKEKIIIRQIEDPRLVEQDFGDFDLQYMAKWPEISPHSYKINQAKYTDPTGRFFARLENGENLLDVYNRVSLFATTRLERDMNNSSVQNYIIVTHANTMRVLKMFLLGMPIESFVEMKLPQNAGGFHIGYSKNNLVEYTLLDEF